MITASCAGCDYPLNATHTGQVITCPMCETVNEMIGGVEIPTPIFAFSLGFLISLIVGPALLATSDWGKRWLEKKARGA